MNLPFPDYVADASKTGERPPLLDVRNLSKHFGVIAGGFGRKARAGVRAVDGISLRIARGETLGLVGESGCGKSTAGRSIIQLHRPTTGEVYFDGIELTRLKDGAMRRMRRHMQMVFQDPYASLNPKMTIGDIVAEPLKIHRLAPGRQRGARVAELLELVGLSPGHTDRYPYEFSGGQRQRIGIARALAAEPALIICDEPVSALDVSIQAQIVNLLEDLQSRLQLAYLFIAHDLSVVRHISDRVAVMYLGRIVELADSDTLYEAAKHPYTQALLSALPRSAPHQRHERERIVLSGELPSAANPPSGCRFRTRCPYAMEVCAMVDPAMERVGPSHEVACHLYAGGSDKARGAARAFEPARPR
jgi:oligopeptide transport system ATP-binding protein